MFQLLKLSIHLLWKKKRYTLRGVIINRVKDIFIDDYIKRISGNKTLFIKYGKVIKEKQNIILKAIPIPIRNKSTYYFEYNTIGVIYTETYISKDGTVKIYALGFKSVLNKYVVMYNIDR